MPKCSHKYIHIYIILTDRGVVVFLSKDILSSQRSLHCSDIPNTQCNPHIKETRQRTYLPSMIGLAPL